MGAENDAVAGFQADQRLENGGGGGVGGGDHRGHHADGLGDFLHAVCFVFFDHAAGFGVPVSIVNVFAGVVVLDHLVLHHAHAGFLHGQLGQGNAGPVGCRGRGQEDPIHLLLGVGREDPLRGAHSVDGRFQRFHAVHHVKCFLFHTVPPSPVCVIRWLSSGDKPGIMRYFPDAPSHGTAL